MLTLQKGYSENDSSIVGAVFAAILAAMAIGIIFYMFFKCPQTFPTDRSFFKAPLVPFVPAIAIMFNWYLLAQTSNKGLYYSLLLFVLALVVYFGYGYHNSAARNDWKDRLNGSFVLEGKPSLVDVIPSADWMYGNQTRSSSTSLERGIHAGK